MLPASDAALEGWRKSSGTARAFHRGGASCLLAVPLEMCGPTIAATWSDPYVHVVDDA